MAVPAAGFARCRGGNPADNGKDTIMFTDNEIAERQDQMLNDATHAVANVFAHAGIELTTDELYRINDLLTELLDGRIPR